MLIAIDAGHGHNTAGKRCPDDSMREHDFNGNVATKVCEILNRSGIETYRSDDVTGNIDVPLMTRTNEINARNANYCISIHANANTGNWNSANGIETYIIARGGQAEKIANIVQAKLIDYTGRRDRGVKVKNLHMCRETKMPAILCECGFMDNREEAELLKSEEYRQKCANAIADGILEYLGIERVNVQPQEQTPVNNNENKGSEEKPMYKFKNGKTVEPIYADTNHTVKIGSLDKYEECDCYGIINGAPMVLYRVGKTNNYKVGFAVDTRCVK